ncbi:MAG: hypothetical protein FWE09_02845 [Treponema sp.]|nr:hypothetical protein [Treponema sp.]
MEDIFANEIREFAALPSGDSFRDSVKARYLELVKKYHPDANREIEQDILHEYMVIINGLFERKRLGAQAAKQATEAKAEKDSPIFNFQKFASLFVRYAYDELSALEDRAFERAELARLLVREIGKADKAASEAFAFLNTEEVMATTDVEILLEAFGSYVNRPIFYKKPMYIYAAERMGDSYFRDYKDACKEHASHEEIKRSVDAISAWLKATNREHNA